jgi:hypothetical protein
MKRNLKTKIMIPIVAKMKTVMSDSNDEDMYDEMDPDAIAALSDPTTLQDDEDGEESNDKQ